MLRYAVAAAALFFLVATAPYEEAREPAMTCSIRMELPAGRWLFRGSYANAHNQTLDLYRVRDDGTLQLHTPFKGDARQQPITYDYLDMIPYSRTVYLPMEGAVLFVAKGWCPRLTPYRLPTTGPFRDLDFLPPTEGSIRRGVMLLTYGTGQALVNIQRGLHSLLTTPSVVLTVLFGSLCAMLALVLLSVPYRAPVTARMMAVGA